MSQSNVVVPPAAPVALATPPEATPPAAVVPPAAAPAASTPPVVVPPASTELPPVPTGAENWLKPRLDQAKGAAAAAKEKELFGALGVKDAAEAKSLLSKAREAEEAAKTELQKAKERGDSFAAQAARATDLEKVVKARADTELALLTDAQRAAVAAVAGDDPARTLSTIDALKPTWIAAPPATPPVVPPAAAPPAPVTPPATTSPPPNAPGGAPTTSPPDRKAEYAALKTPGSPKYNPHAAAVFLNKYSDDIYPRA